MSVCGVRGGTVPGRRPRRPGEPGRRPQGVQRVLGRALADHDDGTLLGVREGVADGAGEGEAEGTAGRGEVAVVRAERYLLVEVGAGDGKFLEQLGVVGEFLGEDVEEV